MRCMVRPELDWKKQGRNIFNWLTIVFAVVLITVYLTLWWMDGQLYYLQLALLFFVWLGVFFTGYWQPILYLVMASVIIVVLIFWAYEGLWDQPLGHIATLLKIAFLLLVTYLYYYEARVGSPG